MAALALWGAAATAAGCGGPALPVPIREPPCLRAPCRAAHEGEEPIPVPYPPPPAKADVIGEPANDLIDPVWVDGQWVWRGRGWVWEHGKWVARPASQYYAAPAIVRRPDGQLVWFAGSFRPFGAPIPAAKGPARAVDTVGGLPSAGVPGQETPRSP